MADIIIDGKVKVSWVPTIADISAPTVAELDAGDSLEDTLTADGLRGFDASTAEVDNTALSSTFDTKLPGRASYSGTMLTLKKQDGVDDVYDTLTRETAGFVVIRRGTDADTTWTASDDVEVYPVTCGEVVHPEPEANSVQKYQVPAFITAEPELRATVSA